jgi:hypothetical protein
MGKYTDRGRNPPHLIGDGDPPAVALIKQDHQMFRALFDMAEGADERALIVLAGEICIRLSIHMTVEEELLYPALRPALDADEIDEGIVEHQIARRMIVEIAAMTGREELFRPKVHVLGEETMHHIDEEDCGLLKDARAVWEAGKVDLVLLGQQMRELRQALYDLVASIGRDSAMIDIEPIGDEIEELAGSRSTAENAA